LAVLVLALGGCSSTQYLRGELIGRDRDGRPIYSWESFQLEGDLVWVLRNDGNSIAIVGYRGTNTDVQIPSQIGDLPVTEIQSLQSIDHLGLGRWRHTSSTPLTSVNIPDGVTTILAGVFANNQLTTITIPNSVTSIGEAAFANNPQLASVTIGNGVGSLDENVFTGSLRNLTRISIGANVNLSAIRARITLSTRNSQATVENSDVVWVGFHGAYTSNGNQAGVYTLSGGRWNFQPR